MDEVASQAMIALDRARSASRTKLHQEAVGGSQKLPGEVDESETGSITLDQARSELAGERRQDLIDVPVVDTPTPPPGPSQMGLRKGAACP